MFKTPDKYYVSNKERKMLIDMVVIAIVGWYTIALIGFIVYLTCLLVDVFVDEISKLI